MATRYGEFRHCPTCCDEDDGETLAIIVDDDLCCAACYLVLETDFEPRARCEQ